MDLVRREEILVRVMRPIALLGAMALLASGCNGGSDGTAPATPQPPSSPAPEGVGRTTNEGWPVDPGALSLIESVYGAASARDTETLRKLCYPCADAGYAQQQLQLWQQPGILEQVVRVLGTHPAQTDGYSYPGFALAGLQSVFDVEDAKALGVPVPDEGRPGATVDYHGVTTTFVSPEASAGDSWAWLGVSTRP